MFFLLFPLFFAVFSFFIAQKIQDFLRCSSGWGFGGLGRGVLGRGWGGGGHNSVRVCVCCRFAPSLFFNGCKRFFLCAKTLIFLSGASGFVIVRAAWTVSVTFGFFWGGFWGFWVYVCYIWYIWYLWYLWYTWYLCLWYYIYIHVYMC